MHTAKSIWLWIGILAVTSTLQGPQSYDPTSKHVTVESQETTPINYISTLFRTADVWGGIENYRLDCAPKLEIHLPPTNGTLGDALMQLKAQDNSIQWRAEGGGIHVRIKQPATSLLDTDIGDFSFYKHDRAEQLTDRLLNLSAIRARETQLKLTPRAAELGFAQPRVAAVPADQVILHAANLRQALDAIASADHARVWLFEQNTCGDQTTFLIQWLVK